MRTVIVLALALSTVLVSNKSSANEIYITQTGDYFYSVIDQQGENNQIKGNSTQAAQIEGDWNRLGVFQGVEGNNLLEVDIDGDENEVSVFQEKTVDITESCFNGSCSYTYWVGDDTSSVGEHSAAVDIVGNNNRAVVIQRNNSTSSAGHISSITINGGENNNVVTLQTGTGSSNGHHSAVRINSNDSGNIVDIFQNSDTADQRLELSIYSDNNDIDIDQTGTANQAYVLFSGSNAGGVDFTLSQNGGDTYGNIDTGSYVTINCSNVNGCIVNVSQ